MHDRTSPLKALPADGGREYDSDIERMLMETGKLTSEEVEHVHRLQLDKGLRFCEAARRMGFVTEAEIRQLLSRQRTAARLPQGETRRDGFPNALTSVFFPSGGQVETLRSVRDQLMSRWFKKERSALVVASIDSGEGASVMSAYLAILFAQLREDTLLVDANLQHPRQRKIFGLPDAQGLSDLLCGSSDVDVISAVEGYPHLFVLAGGTHLPNSRDLLSQPIFGEWNSYHADRFDVVLYDVGEFSTGNDAFAVCSQIGGVLLVAGKDSTRIADIRSVNERLIRTGVEVVGSLMLDF